MDWNEKAVVCGNCKFWALSGYQPDWQEAEPQGNRGYHSDGHAGECRLRGPTKAATMQPSGDALWPITQKLEWCGEFKSRHFASSVDDGESLIGGDVTVMSIKELAAKLSGES